MQINNFTVGGYLLDDPQIFQTKDGDVFYYLPIETGEYSCSRKISLAFFGDLCRKLYENAIKGDYIVASGHLKYVVQNKGNTIYSGQACVVESFHIPQNNNLGEK
jgi:single-stranded DNA-binding protein